MTQQAMATRKKKRAEKRKRKKANARIQKEVAKRPSLQSDLELFQEGQDVKLKAVGSVLNTLWRNQRELDRAHHKLDQQQWVLARLLIPIINDVLIRICSDDLINQETIGQVFLDWDEFTKRPDYKNLLVEWMMGVPLAELPPPPEVKEEEEKPKEAPTESGSPQEFGGDYAEGQASGLGDETDPEEQSEGQSGGEEDEVPEGQDADNPTPAEG